MHSILRSVLCILAILCVGACAQDPGDDGLVAWWSFDEALEGQVADLSGNDNDGMLQGGAELVPGIHEKGLNCNGKDAHVTSEGSGGSAAKAEKIPCQVKAANRGTGTDANAIQPTRAGVATGLVSIPNRYMHTPVELVSLKDAENAAKLLAAFTRRLTDAEEWSPI